MFLKKKSCCIESVFTVALHTLLSIQNILLFLVFYLTQKLTANKQLALALDLDLCSFDTATVAEPLNDEEKSLLIQYSYVVVNNLIYLHLNAYKKVSILNFSFFIRKITNY